MAAGGPEKQPCCDIAAATTLWGHAALVEEGQAALAGRQRASLQVQRGSPVLKERGKFKLRCTESVGVVLGQRARLALVCTDY
eukprot:2175504-Pleurochrysis_carterae.AAC.1